jgi:phosphoribosylformimino-5-aminoimidazole carboxamide ribotide isomerase
MDDIQAALDRGVYRVVLGTAAVRNPDLVSEAVAEYTCSRIVVGIDAKDGEVRVEGWTEGSDLDAVEFAQDMERRGVRRIVYTDISRDGTMEGPNILAYRTLGEHLQKARITASGGVGDYKDLIRLNELTPYRVDSVIVGRALYENKFPCQKLWCWHYKDILDLDCYSTAPLKAKEEEAKSL